MAISIPKRQVHLDFHTSGLIDNVGAKFDAKAFGKAFKDAHVDSVCLFTRCHHGYCYYPTKVGTVHPGLARANLLDEQIKALDAVGVGHTFYTTICWDELSAHNHPEWLMRDSKRTVIKIRPDTQETVDDLEPGWRFLCWNTDYRKYLHEHLREICERYTINELFLDILSAPDPGCLCASCRRSMLDQGIDPVNNDDVRRHTLETAREFMYETASLIRSHHPDARLWFNSRLRLDGNVRNGSIPEIEEYMQYTVIESLPSGFWGYNHFPLYARYYQNKSYPLLSHTGRFQKMWGDFGGLKNQAALDYECWRMVSLGYACSVGDQLHPSGAIDSATYRLIGNTYKQVAEIERHAYPSKPVDEIGILLTNQPVASSLLSETGAMRMLTERQYQFSLIDELSDLSEYRAVILPDHVCITDRLRESLEAYLANGGRLLVTGASGRDGYGRWSLSGVPLVSKGTHPFLPYYAVPRGGLLDRVPYFRHVLYTGGEIFSIDGSGWEVLATVTYPYFDRTAERFCSHLQTPPAEDTNLPEMAVYKGKVAVIGSYIFDCYAQFANRFAREMVECALDRLLPERIFVSNLPTTAEVTVRDREDTRLVHILHYVPQRRGTCIDIVEDPVPLVDMQLSVEVIKAPTRVVALPRQEEIAFSYDGHRVNISLARLDGYRLLMIQ